MQYRHKAFYIAPTGRTVTLKLYTTIHSPTTALLKIGMKTEIN
jgi:hypothetical protein